MLRQGGLQRRIWLWEAMAGLKGLTMIGDFDDYVDAVLEFYFYKLQKPNGEVVTLGEPWANATASAIMSFVPLARKRGIEYFQKFRDNVYKAFLWIKNTRAKSLTMDNMLNGLFPALW